MTNEEAIKRLKSDIYKYSDFTENPNENEFWTAFDMAIKALEQEPCEDCISRLKVLDEINRIGVNGFETYNDYSQLYDFVDTLPPVTPQPKIGRWILYRDHKNMIDYPQCDNCRAIIKLPLPIDNLNFCPNCGRKMAESEG